MVSVDQQAVVDRSRALGRAHSGHYVVLDGLRGVAALCVLLFHYRHWFGGGFGSGYLAVDFFFMLSGFVVAYAYGDKLSSGMSIARFSGLRLIRLYPLILVSLAGSAAIQAARVYAGQAAFGFTALGTEFVRGLVLVPTFHSAVHPNWVYPLDNVLWSLFFELAANLALAVLYPQITWRALAIVTFVSAILYAALATQASLGNAGVDSDSFWYGFARVAFPFPFGVVLYRMHRDGRLPALRMSPLILAVLLAAVLAPPGKHAWFELAVVFVAFPVIIVAGIAQHREHAGLHPLWELSGRLSYPVYLLNVPVYQVATITDRRLNMHGSPLVGLAALVSVLAASWLLLRFYDEPLRLLLNRRWRGRSGDRPAGEAQPAPRIAR